jgi:hypothetical protein
VRYIDALSGVQGALGALNDVAVFADQTPCQKMASQRRRSISFAKGVAACAQSARVAIGYCRQKYTTRGIFINLMNICGKVVVFIYTPPNI